MEKQIILFDLDDTLFSKTEYLKRLNDNLARECNTSSEQIADFGNKYFESLGNSNDFHIKKYLEYLGQNFNKEIDLENFTTDKLKIYSGSLFSDTIPVLEKLKDNFRLGIYSQGFDDCQRIKINESGIGNYFDEELIFIARNKSDPKFIERLPDGSTIVDDKKEKFEALKETERFNLVWINRKDDEVMDGIETIRNLEKLVDLVKVRAV